MLNVECPPIPRPTVQEDGGDIVFKVSLKWSSMAYSNGVVTIATEWKLVANC